MQKYEVSMGISTVVITFNEETNIEQCLNSLAFADEIVEWMATGLYTASGIKIQGELFSTIRA